VGEYEISRAPSPKQAKRGLLSWISSPATVKASARKRPLKKLRGARKKNPPRPFYSIPIAK
jgi:hypothetical protein